MPTITDLRARREALSAQRSSGVARVSYDGKTVDYRSVAEIDRAIEALDREIAAAEGRRIVRHVRVTTAKGALTHAPLRPLPPPVCRRPHCRSRPSRRRHGENVGSGGWNPPLENINALVASGGPRLLARSRELVVTNGYAANACEAFAANLVGDGIKPSSLIGDAGLRDQVQRLWLAWTDEADADGLTDFYGLQAMVAREMFVAGECFVRLRPRRAEDGLLVPLQLQLLQSEMLPFEKTDTAANGNRIRCGIEFDLIGRRVAYHFRRRHPGDSTDQGARSSRRQCACRRRTCCTSIAPSTRARSGGCRISRPPWCVCSSWTSTTTPELDRKKTAAMFAGFITKTAPEEPMMGEAEADLDGAAIASLEPGTMQVLLPGEDVKFSSPADVGGGYEAFQYRTLLAVSASLGLPYHLVTGDVRQANYSSLRAELVEFRRRIGQLQHGVIVHQLCRAVWRRWLETAVLSGALDADPATARPVQWIPPRWDWVDPLKDIQAQVLAMEAGITSRRKVVEATGYDIEEVDRENASDAARATGLGLRYRTSPDETQGARATPATRPDPGAGAGNDTDDGADATDPATEQE